MKVFAAVFSILTVFVLVSNAQKAAGGAGKPDPAKPVRDAFDRLIEGIRQVDADKLMSVYDNSERTLFFNNNGSVTMGWSQMKENRTLELREDEERHARDDWCAR